MTIHSTPFAVSKPFHAPASTPKTATPRFSSVHLQADENCKPLTLTIRKPDPGNPEQDGAITVESVWEKMVLGSLRANAKALEGSISDPASLKHHVVRLLCALAQLPVDTSGVDPESCIAAYESIQAKTLTPSQDGQSITIDLRA